MFLTPSQYTKLNSEKCICTNTLDIYWKSLACGCATILEGAQKTEWSWLFWPLKQKSIQILSAAEMYLKRKFLISEMCIVSLMVVSRLRTWRRPLSVVFSLITTVKSTPISSYLEHKDRIDTSVRETLLTNVVIKLVLLQSCTKLYFAFSSAIDVGSVLRYPGHTEILASINSCASPSQTFSTMEKNICFLWLISNCDAGLILVMFSLPASAPQLLLYQCPMLP